MERWQVMQKVAERMKANPDLRLGQTVFSVIYNASPDEANRLNGTKFDPYYDDSRVDAFLAELGVL